MTFCQNVSFKRYELFGFIVCSNARPLLSGDATDIKYLAMTNCDLQMVGDEFSRKPYAIAVQQGSALKEQFNNAYVPIPHLKFIIQY